MIWCSRGLRQKEPVISSVCTSSHDVDDVRVGRKMLAEDGSDGTAL